MMETLQLTVVYLCGVVVLVAVMGLCDAVVTESLGEKCFKNPDYGDYPANVYYCADPDLPECCEVDEDFTCCEKQGSHTMKHQLILWGSVFGVVGLVAFIWVCYRKDTYMCEGETLGVRLKRCCGCEKKVNPEDEKVELSDLTESNERIKWQEDMTTGTDVDYYNDVPVTSRGVTPIVKGHDMYGGNDSDSGRGSTTSMDGSRHTGNMSRSASRDYNQPQPLENELFPSGSTDRKDDLDEAPLSMEPQAATKGTKEKKKKKKKSKKKKQPLHDVVEEDMVEEV